MEMLISIGFVKYYEILVFIVIPLSSVLNSEGLLKCDSIMSKDPLLND